MKFHKDDILKRLLEGNQRFAFRGTTSPNVTAAHRDEVAKELKPFAIILGCSDPRVPPEHIFDCWLGDLFVIRVAGQVIDKAVLSSVEFGVESLHIPLLVVLGHSNCGAVEAAIEAFDTNIIPESGFNTLVEAIYPAVEKTKDLSGKWLDNAVRANVELIINRLKQSSAVADAISKMALKVVGAYYDLATGIVEIVVPHSASTME
ncbi:MAG: carbonic anhydrase [Chloroflexi bacterium]|nr:carbonic anhydrase [Chloroflexota bacterium]